MRNGIAVASIIVPTLVSGCALDVGDSEEDLASQVARVDTTLETSEQLPERLTFRVKLTKQTRPALTALNIRTGQLIAEVDPPPGCSLGDVGGDITAFYVDGQLTNTVSNYHSSAVCAPTAAGQTMWNLFDQAAILLNSLEFDWGTQGTCVYPNETFEPCLNVSSFGSGVCDEGVLCAGNYSVDHSTFMTLPPDWIFPDPIPSNCVRLDARQIECRVETPPVNIPAFD
jgi:hypothetical protein